MRIVRPLPPARWLGALLFVLAIATCTQETPPVPDAQPVAGLRVVSLQGAAEWQDNADASWQRLAVGQRLPDGCRLRGLGEQESVVTLDDQRAIRLKPGAVVGLDIAGEEMELLLEAGEVEVEAGDQRPGFRLRLGEEKDTVLLRQGVVRWQKLDGGGARLSAGGPEGRGFRLVMGDASEVAFERGTAARMDSGDEGVRIRMLMGQASITRGAQRTALSEGASFRLKAGELQVVAREPMVNTLRGRGARIKAPGSDRFAPAASARALEPGTTLAAGREAIEWQDGAGSRVRLEPGAVAVYRGAYREGSHREGSLELQSGRARVMLERREGETVAQEIDTGQARVVAAAEERRADVALLREKDRSQVMVRAGEAKVFAGEKSVSLRTGQSAIVAGGQITTARLAPFPFRIGEGQAARIFSDRPLPGVTLAWVAEEDESVVLEVAADRSFQKTLMRERVLGPGLPFETGRFGTFFWRVRRGDASQAPGPVGSVEVARDPVAASRGGRSLSNLVMDTGIQTRILFQGQAPTLTFSWKEVKEAAGYRLRLYAEENLEAPLLETRVAQNRYQLPAGRLREGTYFWYQTALDAADKELAASQMNRLELAFDNSATLLRIDEPRPGQKIQGGIAVVRGLAPAGSEVWVGKRRLPLDAAGRFEQRLTNLKPGEALVFELRQRGEPVLYVVRHLGG